MNNLKNTYYEKILGKNIEFISYLIYEIPQKFQKNIDNLKQMVNSERTSKKHYAEKFEKFCYLNFCEKILGIFTNFCVDFKDIL